jgi:hypothetical protein
VLELPGLRPEKSTLDIRFEKYLPVVREIEPVAGKPLDLGDIPLNPGVTLAATVTDRAGKPVEGALVQWPAGRMKEIRETVSGADGGFSLEHVPAGEVEIGVTAKGFLDLKTTCMSPAGDAKPRITLSRGALVTGRLVDGEGEPLGAHLEDGRTGDDGRIDMCIPQGRCRTLFFEDEEDFRVLAEL